MAWISVHEQVIGGKLRSLAKEIGCSQNEALGLLVRLWLWGINNAGKDGRIIGADKEDIAEVLTIGIDKQYLPEAAVNALVKTEWIDMEDGLYIHDWEEWQEQWYKALDIRAKNAERKREQRRKAKEAANDESDVQGISGKDMGEDLPSPKLKIPHEEVQKQQPVTAYTKDFEEFWDMYPRKVGKGEAYKKYKARLKDGWSPGELRTAAESYSIVCARKHTEKEYIKHAKTFLSDSTPFTDYLPKNDQQVSSNNTDDPYADWR